MGGWRTGGGNSYNNDNNDGGFRPKSGYQPQQQQSFGNRGSRGGQSSQYQDRGQSGFSRGGRGDYQQPPMYKQKSYDNESTSGSAQQTPNSVFITNLPAEYTEKNMSDLFRDFGMKPAKVKLLYDDSGKSKCAGFVEFSTGSEAQEAVKQANNLNVEGGKRLNVQLAKNKQ